ncbi:MAG: hypothetical protein HYU86_04870 [Chloroflexi bacterium]|nr:hypothetical protein [Chloroflexota bacterium]
MGEKNYWRQLFRESMSRRKLLRGAAGVGLGAVSPDTHQDSTIVGHFVQDMIYDGLTTRDRSLKLVPGLALSWKAVDDLTWEFKLREGVKFHNGEEFNADVVRFNVERQQDVNFKPRYLSDFKNINKIQAVDAYTVRLSSSQPDPILPLRFAQSLIVPLKYIKEKGNAIMGTAPVGTGPYKFIKWVKDDYIELEANSGYWGGPPPIKKITIKPIPQAESRMGALKTGAVDYIYGVPEDLAKGLENEPGLGVKVSGAASCAHIAVSFWAKDSPLQDKRVRQAIRYAIDVDTIIKTILSGYGMSMPTVIQPTYFGYDSSLKPYPFDPKKARELLAAAGFSKGIDVTLHDPLPSYTKDKEMTEAVAGYLNEVGVRAKIQRYGEGSTVVFGKWKTEGKGPEGLLRTARGHASLDADAILSQSIHSKGDINFGAYANPEVDRLIEKGRSTVQPADREKVYRDLMKALYDDNPWIFQVQVMDIFAFNKKKLKNVYPRLWVAHAQDVDLA